MIKILSFSRERQTAEGKRPGFVVIWIVVFLLWIPCFLAYYPGVFGYDIQSQWLQFFEDGIDYTTHHPVIHTVLMGNIFELGNKLLGNYNKGVALYSLIQLLALSASIAYALSRLIEKSIPKWICLAIGIYYITLPLYPIIGVSTTKDVFFSIFFLLAFLFLIDYLEEGTFNKKNCIFFVLSLVFMQGFRNNAVYGVFILLVWLLISRQRRKKRKQLILLLIISVVISKGVLWGVNSYTHALEGSIAEALSVPCQQIARVYHENNETMSEDEKQRIYQYVESDWLGGYREEISDPIKAHLNTGLVKEKPIEFLKLWIEIGIMYPREYVEAFLYNAMGLWYVGDVSLINVKGAYLEVGFKTFDEAPVAKNSIIPALEKAYTDIVVGCSYLKVPLVSLLFSPAFYFWLIIGSYIYTMINKIKDYQELPIYLVGYCITLFAGPCILPRYCMAFMMCVPIMLCCLIYRKDKER